jgi:hypothetical protein
VRVCAGSTDGAPARKATQRRYHTHLGRSVAFSDLSGLQRLEPNRPRGGHGRRSPWIPDGTPIALPRLRKTMYRRQPSRNVAWNRK